MIIDAKIDGNLIKLSVDGEWIATVKHVARPQGKSTWLMHDIKKWGDEGIAFLLAKMAWDREQAKIKPAAQY